MILTIHNESPFQILSSSFSIGPSETGYELQVGADSKTFSTLFSVGANTPRMVTNVANGSYFRLKNNVGNVKVNWQRVCVDGGEGGSGTELEPITEFPVDVPEGTVIAYAGSASATGIYQYVDNEWVAAGGDDLSGYWTSAQTKDYVDEVIEDKELPIAAAVNDLKSNIEARLDQQFYKKKEVNDIAARKVEAAQVAEQIKEYVDPAIAEVNETIAEVNETIEDKELPVSAALNDLNQKISEISGGSGGDMSAYWTSAQTEEAISAATSGKADAVNVTANTYMRFPLWNTQGVITGTTGNDLNTTNMHVNGTQYKLVKERASGDVPQFYAPTSVGTAGEILVSTGNGAPVWSAVTFPDVSNYVTSAQVETQIVEKNYITSAATANMVTSTSVSTIWRGSQAEYDAITTKDPNTFYIIINN